MAAQVQRWTFLDLTTLEQATVPLNPNEMTSPYAARKFTYLTTTAGPAGSLVINEGRPEPQQWTFSGEILNQAHFNFLRKWTSKTSRVQIVDHFGRRINVLFVSFAPTPKRATNYYWRHGYTVTCTVLGVADPFNTTHGG